MNVVPMVIHMREYLTDETVMIICDYICTYAVVEATPGWHWEYCVKSAGSMKMLCLRGWARAVTHMYSRGVSIDTNCLLAAAIAGHTNTVLSLLKLQMRWIHECVFHFRWSEIADVVYVERARIPANIIQIMIDHTRNSHPLWPNDMARDKFRKALLDAAPATSGTTGCSCGSEQHRNQ